MKYKIMGMICIHIFVSNAFHYCKHNYHHKSDLLWPYLRFQKSALITFESFALIHYVKQSKTWQLQATPNSFPFVHIMCFVLL